MTVGDEPGNTDVLIVGAGPTGLLAACLLAQGGIHVRIVDKSPSPAKESRAFAIQARTLEVLLSIGLAEAFLDRGTVVAGARLYLDGQPSAGFDFERVGHPDTPFPFVLVLPQFETEAILVDHLARLGVGVERGVAALALRQDEAGVTLTVEEESGRPGDISCRYLIGADGAHSMVRKALGLTFEGAPYAQTFLLADCSVDGLPASEPFSVFLHGSHFALWFPLKGGRFGRVIATGLEAVADPSLAGQGTAPATLSEVEHALRAASQRDLRLSEPVWLSRYRVHHRGVDRYGVGRAFVAGDAAHIHSPAGGQGMNTGFQDAYNLAWKIALALRSGAPPALLASYDAERRPVGERVLAVTDRMFSLATAPSRWVSALRGAILPVAGATLAHSDGLRARAFHLLSELGIAYESGAAVQDERAGGGWPGGPVPGGRAPNAAISRTRSVFDLLVGYRFHLLAFSRTPLSAEAIARIDRALRDLAAGSGLDIGCHLIARSLIGRGPGFIQIESDMLLSAYGVLAPVDTALYLVRPDGHVAWRAPSLDLAGCAAFMAGRFGEAQGRVEVA
jgi:2-polyprenyl-6-methoxyphenol hydroxylase-like FAD-dependent oxidoreductase